MYLVNGVTFVHGFRDDKHAFVSRLAEGSVNVGYLQLLVFHKSMHALANHTQSLLDSLFKVASYRHYLAHGLHRRAQFFVNAAELREIPAWNLANHIVEGGLEECTGGLGD